MCHYRFKDGSECPHPDEGKGLCFWHDPTIDKSGMDLKEKLENIARDGQSMEGFHLARANLEGINLVRHGGKTGYSLARADLYRTNLRGAHMFKVDLSEASLMKADCREANLHFADFRDANLLGAKLDNAKIENVNWGKRLLHERMGHEALKAHRRPEAMDYFEQGEEICRHLRKVGEAQGLFELSGTFFYKEMIMRRLQMPILSAQRWVSALVDRFCGYGERPARVIIFSMSFVFICAFLYFLMGIGSGGELISLDLNKSVGENIITFFKTLYFSVVTFTTLGYGDIVPIGPSKVLAAIEAFTGSFTLALFVVVFVKKMTR